VPLFVGALTLIVPVREAAAQAQASSGLIRNSALTGVLGAPPAYGRLLPSPTGGPFQPDVLVFDQDFRNPRTISATQSSNRICADGSILTRNTLRKNSSVFAWDVRVSKPIRAGRTGTLEVIAEVFNVLNRDNFKDSSNTGLFSASTAPSAAASASRGRDRWACVLWSERGERLT
jgi:hypothetical protein